MISAPTAFQLYKADGNEGTVSSFNALPVEASLPYKVRASEAALLASLAVVEASAADKVTYAVSTLRTAGTYLSQLASIIPLLSRSADASSLQIDYDALARTVALYNADPAVFESMRSLVVGAAKPADVSVTTITDLEGSIAELEREQRRLAKEEGRPVPMLRRVSPPEEAAATARQKSASPGRAGSAAAAAAVKRNRSPTSPRAPSAAKAEASDVKTEDEEGEGDASAAPVAKAPKTEKPRGRARAPQTLVMGRLRALTSGEKKVVALLNSMTELLAHVHASRFNELVPVFDVLRVKVREAEGMIETERAAFAAKEDSKPPEPFHEVTLEGITAALESSEHTFRTDEECRHELDDDLLHPIAHACLAAVNHIEGYTTAPFVPPTPQELARKAKAREAAREKREEARRRVEERVRAREELAARKEEERQMVQQQLGGFEVKEELLVNDAEITNPVPTGYVRYSAQLPLEDDETNKGFYERALVVWSTLASVPRALKLSQMPFTLFLRALQEEDQDANGLMEEITRCLLEVTIESSRISSPNTPRITTRGKNWFEALVEFVGVASGNKKHRQQLRRAAAPPSSDDDDDDETDESESESIEEEEEEEEEEESDAASEEPESAAAEDGSAAEDSSTGAAAGGDGVAKDAAAAEEPETRGFDAALKRTMDEVLRLRSLATWGNVSMEDRLNLLQFCVQEALQSEVVATEAGVLLKEQEDSALQLERRLREIQDEASKELRAAQRQESSRSTKEEKAANEAARKKIMDAAAETRLQAFQTHYSRWDGEDIGAIIEPLGEDRYRRMYWRFPMSADVYVQSTVHTDMSFPILEKPKEVLELEAAASRNPGLLLDDEEEDSGSTTRSKVKTADAAAPQKMWGVIPAGYISTFAKGLDARGRREAKLRSALEDFALYAKNRKQDQNSQRVTRSRSHTFGYLNSLRDNFY